MNVPISQYPTEGSSNENVLFATLGAFWSQVFNDQAVLHGLTQAQAEEIFQDYYRLIDAVNSYSSSEIAVFDKVKWLPLLIKKSSLNSNVLLFGEQVDGAPVLFNTVTNYIFGAAKPEEAGVYVAPLPADLSELSIIANRVIAPNFVLVNNMDVKVNNGYLYFYGDPFKLSNISTYNILDSTGKQVYYNNPLTGQPIPDQMLVLWVYNGKIDNSALQYNIAYLFGVNLPSSKQSKEILDATVKLFSNGPDIYQIKAICCAFLGIKPILEEQETVQAFFETDTDTVLITDKHVYRYPIYYTLDPSIQVSSVLSIGDVPVDAVEYYDNLTYRNWWLNKIVPKISIETGATIKSPSMIIPSSMFLGNYKYGLIFDNAPELIVRASNGKITFPVNGDPDDVAAFQAQINEDPQAVADAVGSLQPGSALLINPLDFLFKSFLLSNSAMIKVNFQNQDQLIFFTQYFPVIRGCFPKHVFFTFFFDTPVAGELYDTAEDTYLAGAYPGVTMPSLQVNRVGASESHVVSMNKFPSITFTVSYGSFTNSENYGTNNRELHVGSTGTTTINFPGVQIGDIVNITIPDWTTNQVGYYYETTNGGGPVTWTAAVTAPDTITITNNVPGGSSSFLDPGSQNFHPNIEVKSPSGQPRSASSTNNAYIAHNILVRAVPTIYYGTTAYNVSGYTAYTGYTGYTAWSGSTAVKISNLDYNFLEVMQSP